MRLLIVEDDAELCRELGNHLTACGYAVDAFSNAEEVLERLDRDETYDAAVLDILSAQKYTGVVFPAGLTYVRPMAASLVMGGAAWGVHRVLMLVSSSLKWNAVATLIAIMVAVAVYAVMLFVTRSLTRDDLEHLPKGEKLASLYDRILG